MSELTDQIIKVINESLPAQVGDALKQRLSKADRESSELEMSKIEVNNLQKIRSELQKELNEHKSISERMEALKRMDAEVTAKLIRQELNDLKVAQAEVRVEDLKEVVGLVFANNRYKYSECTNKQVPGDPGSYLHYANESKSVESEG